MTIHLTPKEIEVVTEAIAYFPAEYWEDELTTAYDKLEEASKPASQLASRQDEVEYQLANLRLASRP